MSFRIEELTISATDGFPLAATIFHSASPSTLFAVVAPALGVPRKYYAHFCRYLAHCNISTVTFDYRGFGGSGPTWRPDAAVSMCDLGRRDLSAVLSFTHGMKPGSDLYFVGHSFGMMALAFAPNAAGASRAISVATGSAYYRFQPFPRSLLRLAFLTVIVPRIARLHGHFPGRMFGILGNIPQTIVADMARCCREKNFVKDAMRHDNSRDAPYRGDIWALSFTDDRLLPRAAVDDFHGNFSAARVLRSHLKPDEIGRRRVGHNGAFQLGSDILWNEMVKWLQGGRANDLPPMGR
jgi:predicted alpha/beta hydrolase